MRVWKLLPLLLIIFTVACSPKPAEEPATDVATPPTETAASNVPEPAPAPEVAPVPAVPAPSKPAKTSAKPASASPKVDAAPAPPAPAPAPAPPPKPQPVIIPTGTELNVILVDPLNSGKNKADDEFSANLAAPVYVNGATILERGAKVEGKVIAAEGSGRVSGKATMTIALTGVMHKGKMVSLVTKDVAAEAESSTKRDTGVVAGGAGIGALIGAIAGGGKGAAIGAAVGGAGGTGAVLATKGKEVDYPAESKLTFILDKDLSVMP